MNPGTSPLLSPTLAMNMACTLFGLTPDEALQGMTTHAARALGLAHSVGSIAAGKQADLVVIKGDPSKNIEDIENVETVFKDGVGYDSAKLIDSVRGVVGSR